MGINEKKNLRYLLSSLYEIWTCDSSWADVSMQNLIQDEAFLKVFHLLYLFLENLS